MARPARLVLPVILATLAFAIYSRSLLPGLDLGDTAAFQSAVLRPVPSARQSYPLYYTMAGPFVSLLSPGDPARGLNLLSAVWGAVAVGLLAWVTTAVGRSIAGGITAGLLLAFSYTFWSQAIIAEVYTLHLALVGGALVALHTYSVRPTMTRLALFCAIYALGFGNHLSLILWFVPCAAFVLLAHPTPRQLLRPGVVIMAAAIAMAGALQYAPVVTAGWTAFDAPDSVAQRLATMWRNVTMSEWREAMLLAVHRSALGDRVAMWAWDAHQQFGSIGLAAAAAGAVRLWWLSRPWAALVWLAYATNSTFAVTYNVGDPHVFFLPGHYLTALAAGIGVAPLTSPGSHTMARQGVRGRVAGPVAAAAVIVVIAYAAWRGRDTWPAAERHDDRRAYQLVSAITGGLDGREALLISGLNWDQENALRYASLYLFPHLAWVTLDDVLAHTPALIADNHAIGRDVVLDGTAAATVAVTHGLDIPPVPEPGMPASLGDTVAGFARGTPYVLTVLPPVAAFPLSHVDLDAALDALTGGRAGPAPPAPYLVMAGLTGDRPSVQWAETRPFHRDLTLIGDRLLVRMDGWIPTETFRRGGFGHVIRNRQRLMFIERGVSLLWLAPDGSPHVIYAAGPYAPPARFRVPVPRTQLASR